MQLIPVVDLQSGQAVHARRGERGAYRPLRSALVDGSSPVPVARALLAAAGSDTLYVADLDAIVRGQPDVAVLQALIAALPGCTIWLDAGFADADAARALLARLDGATAHVRPVFGTESLRNRAALEALPADAILSLDRRGEMLLDPAGAGAAEAGWPSTLIAMDLARVGSELGPDTAAIAALRSRAPRARLIGAGGLRDAADLAAAAASGAAGWLVASALHDGRLGPGRSA